MLVMLPLADSASSELNRVLLQRLRRLSAESFTSEYTHTRCYDSHLRLQPLMDNLDSQTYEVFEKDPIKYVQYEKVSVAMAFHQVM